MGEKNNYQKGLKQELFCKNKMNLIIAIIFAVILSCAQVYIAIVLKNLINAATSSGFDLLKNEIIKSSCFLGGYIVVAFIGIYFRNDFFYRGLKQYKSKLFTDILDRNLNAFDDSETSIYISALNNDINSIETNYLENILRFAEQITLLIGGLVAMIWLNPVLFLCVLCLAIIPAVVSAIFGKPVEKCEIDVSEKNSRFVACVRDLLSGFSVIKTFKAENQVIKVYDNTNKELELSKRKKRYINSTVEILSNAAGMFMVIIVFVVGAIYAIKGYMDIGVIVAFIQLLNYVLQPVQQLPPIISKIKAAKALISKIDVSKEIKTQKTISYNEFQEKILFHNVSFEYVEGKKTLDDINLVFEKGKSYAVVGSSGSGKSTLLKLLLGFSDDYQGSISIDGKEISSIITSNLYDIFSVIQQNVFIFNSTIRDNVTMFHNFDENKLQSALKISGLEELIRERGENYKCNEGGEGLSGGEKQRIAIARCILKDVPIFLMDEATAALDNTTSFAIESAVLNANGITKIIVTHKLNPNLLRKYDNIIVLKNGKISEKGNFEELLQKNGDFAALYKISECAE